MPKRNADSLAAGGEKSSTEKKRTRGSYTASQKAAIAELQSVTTVDKTVAAKLLRSSNWNVASAANAYFSNPPSSITAASRTALTKLFDKYRDSPHDEPDEIGPEGTSNMLGEMQIGLDDIGALVFSELVQSPSLGRIVRDPFVEHCGEADADSASKIRNLVLQRRGALQSDPALFKRVYNHTFVLALQGGQKSLPPELAAEFWRMLFSPPGVEWRTSNAPWLEWWLEFIGASGRKAVNKDLWRQTLAFAEASIRDDTLGFWNEESSWPSVIDEFVEWAKKEKGAGGAKVGGDAMDVE